MSQEIFVPDDYCSDVIANLLLVAQGRVLLEGDTYQGQGAYFFFNTHISECGTVLYRSR